jgi:hypothetical protein
MQSSQSVNPSVVHRSHSFRHAVCGNRLLGLLVVVMAAAGMAQGQTLPGVDTQVRTSDLIRLATSSSEALGELKIAQLKLETLQALRATTAVSSLEIRAAEITVTTAEQKVGFLRKIAEAELAAAKADLETQKQLLKMIEQDPAADAPPRPRLVRAEANVAILQMILDAQ